MILSSAVFGLILTTCNVVNGETFCAQYIVDSFPNEQECKIQLTKAEKYIYELESLTCEKVHEIRKN